jgi:hypothetical protein
MIDAITGATSMQYIFGLHSETATKKKYCIETDLISNLNFGIVFSYT